MELTSGAIILPKEWQFENYAEAGALLVASMAGYAVGRRGFIEQRGGFG